MLHCVFKTCFRNRNSSLYLPLFDNGVYTYISDYIPIKQTNLAVYTTIIIYKPQAKEASQAIMYNLQASLKHGQDYALVVGSGDLVVKATCSDTVIGQ